MKYFLITDTHFAHNKLHEFEKRKDGWEEKTFKNLKRVIDYDNDVLIHLGDFAFGNSDDIHKRFTSLCKKTILLKGNHDKQSYSKLYSLGWTTVAKSMEIRMFGINIVFSHRPVEILENQINLHGHFHMETLERCFEVEPYLKDLYTNRHVRMAFSVTPVTLKSIVRLYQKGIRQINF